MKAALVSTWHGDGTKYFHEFLRTARKHGMEPHNADPSHWPGKDWTEIPWHKKSQAQANFIKEHAQEFTHFIFTDSYDIVFATGFSEILDNYHWYDSPILFAAETYPWPDRNQATLYPAEHGLRNRYLNAGFWMADTKHALDFAGALEEEAAKKELCDQGICVNMFLSGKWPMKIDIHCKIAYCCNMDAIDHLYRDPESGRLVYHETKSKPCLFHGNGASPLEKVIPNL